MAEPIHVNRNTLTRISKTGQFWITRPGGPTTLLPVTDGDARPLDACAAAAGLTNGYWLRAEELVDPHRVTWTWVQL